jgi:hypothetical protein
MDSRYRIFTLWTDPVHQTISQEVYSTYVTKQNAECSSLDNVRIYKYIFRTQYVCGICKELRYTSPDIVSIARNPTVLFEGDILICTICMTRTPIKPYFRRYSVTERGIITKIWDYWNPHMPCIYNVCYDYYTLLWDVELRRRAYRDPKYVTLFDLLSENLYFS